ncbi:TPR-like protein [Ramaria rubella]|nr:TPR-like protein [Ramaria rubella]
MPSKKTKAQKKKITEANGAPNGNPIDSPAEVPPPSLTPPLKEKEKEKESMQMDVDPNLQADQLKEQGNTAFKAKRFEEAIDFYTKAIALRPTEPTYLTNRAACNMALKFFRPALVDCQNAAALQAAHPVPKTLVRLAKCHLALGSPNPALSAVRAALSAESGNVAAREVERAALRMEIHLSRFEAARTKRDWAHARLALDQAAKECEGSEPIEWRCWRIELELARGKLEQAMTAANEAFQIDKKSPDVLCLRGLVMFLSSRLPAALQHVQQALAYDPDHTRARKLMRRIKDVERLKEEGNTLFKAGKHTEAVEKYTAALDVVESREEEGSGGSIRATLLSNRATALLKLERREEALADTNASLELVATSYKALRTRARIQMVLEDYQSAVNDFKASLEQVRIDGSQTEERALKQELKDAEVALKRSKSKDYYKILGIPKDCADSDIKKAYRKQSLLHHPDKGGDEEKFKLASEAYNVLSDPQKRARYDAGEDDDEGMGGMGGMNQADLADIFASFGGGGGGFHFGGGFDTGGFGGGGQRFHTHSSRPGHQF